MGGLSARPSDGHWPLCPLLQTLIKYQRQGSGLAPPSCVSSHHWPTLTPSALFLLLSPWGVSSLFLLFIHLLNANGNICLWVKRGNELNGSSPYEELRKCKNMEIGAQAEDSVVRQQQTVWRPSPVADAIYTSHGINHSKERKVRKDSFIFIWKYYLQHLLLTEDILYVVKRQQRDTTLVIIIVVQAWKTILSQVSVSSCLTVTSCKDWINSSASAMDIIFLWFWCWRYWRYGGQWHYDIMHLFALQLG